MVTSAYRGSIMGRPTKREVDDTGGQRDAAQGSTTASPTSQRRVGAAGGAGNEGEASVMVQAVRFDA